MTKLIFATANDHKLKEVKTLLINSNITIKGLAEINYNVDIEETGVTLEENALIKVRHMYNNNHLNVFAEDTGLEVTALDGAPGVITARYAGPQKNHNNNMDLMLQNLKNVVDRSAQFRAVIALIIEGKEYLFEGIVKGHIAKEKKGIGGFGYDPIFIPEAYQKSFAELGDHIKNNLSHRARAITKMIAFLNTK